jgi:hypothetical protein
LFSAKNIIKIHYKNIILGLFAAKNTIKIHLFFLISV